MGLLYFLPLTGEKNRRDAGFWCGNMKERDKGEELKSDSKIDLNGIGKEDVD